MVRDFIFFQKKENNIKNIMIKLFNNTTENGFTDTAYKDKFEYSEEPYAFIEKKWGISFNLNELKFGVSIGSNFISALRSLSDSDETSFIEYSDGKPYAFTQ